MRKLWIYCLLSLAPCLLFPAKDKGVHFKADYFIYNKDQNYIYGGGNILITDPDFQIKGNTLYLDVKEMKGAVYGSVEITEKSGTKTCDSLHIKLFPLIFLCEKYDKTITGAGDLPPDTGFLLKSPKDLKKDVYYEFSEFTLTAKQQIMARYIIPYVMGVPSIPLKRIILKRGEIPDKTEFYIQNVNFSQLDGLSLILALQLQEKFLKGSYDIKLFERALFKIGGTKHGFIISGQNQFVSGTKTLLDSKLLLNYDDKSFNIDLKHETDRPAFSFSLQQNISGRQDTETKFNLASNLSYKKIKYITPGVSFTHDLRKSYSYALATPLKFGEKLNLNFAWERKLIDEVFKSDNTTFTSSLSFSSSLLNLSANFTDTRNLIDAIAQKNLTVNVDFTPIKLLERNISFQFSPYALFRTIPMAGEMDTSISRGVALKIASAGVLLPFGFQAAPTYTINQMWDDLGENTTDFNLLMSIKRTIGYFGFSVDYSLTSRYKIPNFWVEGYNTHNLNMNLALKKENYYDYQLGFIFDDRLRLQNVRLNGYVNLPFDVVFSSFVLYYAQDKRFQTVEIFLEKTFVKKLKLQGGYSLALKKFFIKFLIV